jgi:hypothetical protein
MFRAKELLLHSNMPVVAVAKELGYMPIPRTSAGCSGGMPVSAPKAFGSALPV